MNEFEEMGFVPAQQFPDVDWGAMGFIPDSSSREAPNPKKGDPQKQEGNSLASLAKGFVSGVGGAIPDTAALIYNLPAMFQNWQSQKMKDFQETHPEIMEQMSQHYDKTNPNYREDIKPGKDIPLIPSATQGIEKGIDTLTGGYTKTPEEMRHLYEGSKFAGSLLGGGGLREIGKKAALPTVEKIGKSFGSTAPAELGGAFATGTAMTMADEELGPLGGLAVGSLMPSAATKGFQGLKGTLTGKGESLGEMTIGKALSLMGQPSQSIETLSKKYDIPLTFNVRLPSTVSHFLANVGLWTMFRAKRFSDQLENSPQKTLDTITGKIDSIYPHNLGALSTSEDYKEFLLKEKRRVENNYDKMYSEAAKLLKPNEKMELTHTVKALKELRDMLTAPSPSAPQKFVMNKVNELADHLGILRKIKPPNGFTEEQFKDPKLFSKVIEQLEKNNKITANVHDMVQQRKAFLFDTDYGEVEGVGSLLGKLIGALHKDISAIPNQKFVDQWKAANSYYKMEGANRVRSNLARSLTDGDFPRLAYDYMQDPRKIEKLKKIIGPSSKGVKLFNALRRAKLQDVIVDGLTDASGQMEFGRLSNLFSKKNKNQDLLQALLGKKNHNDVHELVGLAQPVSKALKSMQNTSGTTKTLQDLTKLALIGTGLLDLVSAGGTLTLLSGIGYTVGPYILSKLVTNPKYMDAAVRYGLSIKEKRLQDISKYDRILSTIFNDTMRKNMPAILQQQMQKKSQDKKE